MVACLVILVALPANAQPVTPPGGSRNPSVLTISASGTVADTDLTSAGITTRTTTIYFSSGSAVTLTTIPGGSAGRCIDLIKPTGTLAIAHNTGTTAGNRHKVPGDGTWTSQTDTVLRRVCYEAGASRWVLDTFTQVNGLTVNAGHMIVSTGGAFASGAISSTSSYVASYDGQVMLSNGRVVYGYGTNSAVTGKINATGYLDSTTQQRSLEVYDGTGETFAGDGILGIYASDHSLAFTGKLYSEGVVPVLSGCTAPCSLEAYSTDTAGRVTCSDGSALTCTLTFSAAYTTNAPVCIVQTEKSSAVTNATTITAISTSAFSWIQTTSGVPVSAYHCTGMKGTL